MSAHKLLRVASAREVRPDAHGFAESDIRLINALAAYQLLYGKPSEALAFLQLTVRLKPDDPQSLRLLAEAFLAAGDPATAETMAAAYEQAVGARFAAADALRRARIMAGLRKLAAAAAAFADYVRLRRR